MDLVDKDFPRKPRVLVVDDDWLNRDVLSTYLTHMGAEVSQATDGMKALEMATTDPPDLILMDQQMPRMDGLEATKYLKAHPATQLVPIVIITAMEGDEEKMKALQAGADDFLTKPYSSPLLMARARALLKIKHLNDQIRRRNELLRQVLNAYVAPEVAEAVLTNPEQNLRLGGETRTVTVLFADIRGFTPFSEQHTAAEVIDTLNRIFSALTRVVFRYHGTFDKFLGDAIMAFYGAPVSGPDDALRAVQTALALQETFEQLRSEAGGAFSRLGLGIGLHTGDATVGNIGSEQLMDYTVVGDTVNVAKRLTEEAKAGEVLVSDSTYQLVREHVSSEWVESRPVKGRSEPVTVYALTRLNSPAD
jgi:class 3 adenylate cyclase